MQLLLLVALALAACLADAKRRGHHKRKYNKSWFGPVRDASECSLAGRNRYQLLKTGLPRCPPVINLKNRVEKTCLPRSSFFRARRRPACAT